MVVRRELDGFQGRWLIKITDYDSIRLWQEQSIEKYITIQR